MSSSTSFSLRDAALADPLLPGPLSVLSPAPRLPYLKFLAGTSFGELLLVGLAIFVVVVIDV